MCLLHESFELASFGWLKHSPSFRGGFLFESNADLPSILARPKQSKKSKSVQLNPAARPKQSKKSNGVQVYHQFFPLKVRSRL